MEHHRVPSIDGGKSKIKIPAGTQHGKQFRLKGKGMPIIRRSVFGDLYIRVITQVPHLYRKDKKKSWKNLMRLRLINQIR